MSVDNNVTGCRYRERRPLSSGLRETYKTITLQLVTSTLVPFQLVSEKGTLNSERPPRGSTSRAPRVVITTYIGGQ